MSIIKNDKGQTIAGVCECDKYLSDADGSLEWATNIAVFCIDCA
jgi:translation elongation factor EF-Ts